MADAPIPQSKKQALQEVQKNLAHEKEQQDALKNKMAGAKSELDKTRSQLVSLADDIQDNEQNLQTLEDRIASLSKEEADLTAKMKQDYSSIADLILALERMRRIPPEALIVRPGAPLHTAQSAMLLEGTLPAVNHRAEQLSKDLNHLNDVTQSLKADREAALQSQKDLAAKHKDMQTLVARREKLYHSMEGDYASHKRAVAELSREAKTLMDLIARLNKEEERRRSTQVLGQLYGTAMPKAGEARLPVAGLMTVGYGQKDAIGAMSQGISIESRPGAVVVAPMGGIVRFSGTFKNYGNMVIIEHKNGYHSLISGFQRIDTSVDSRVKAGEPIGQLPLTSSRGGRPTLYYELRYKGQPVNPANRFSDLKS